MIPTPPKTLVLSLLLALLFTLPAAANVNAFLAIGVTPAAPLMPGQRVSFSGAVFRAQTSSSQDAADVTMTIPLPPAVSNITISGDSWNCSVQSTTITCTTSLVTGLNSTAFHFGFDAPASQDGGTFLTNATLATSVPNEALFSGYQLFFSVYRVFAVTTPVDFGAGSLRDAITHANDRCDGTAPCLISFSGPMTIEPASQLPAVTGCGVLIDGGVSRTESLDADRPVEISGANAGFANGLEIRSACDVTVRGLTVNRFGANGIVLAQLTDARTAQLIVESCVIGADPGAMVARPNGMRGISVETQATNATIYNSTISGNRYSGIAVWAASHFSLVSCRVGAGRDQRPLGNGASGIFVNGGQASMAGTVVAYNHDFGVAVGPNAAHVDAQADGVFFNGIDLDWGLDGPTLTDPSLRMPPAPVLLDAAYDPARNSTVVLGVLPATRKAFGRYSVRIFEASAGKHIARFPQVGVFNPAAGDARFTLNVAGDLRGRTITGQTVYYEFADLPPLDSSELSPGIVVH